MDMRMRRVWSLGTMVLAGACSGEVPGNEPDPETEPQVSFRVGDPPLLEVEDQVCPAWRQIARRDDPGACGDVPADHGLWKGSSLLPGLVAGDYGKYCLYEFSPAPPATAPDEDDIESLQDRPEFEAVAADCLAVTTQAGLDEVINPELAALVKDRIDMVSSGELELATTEDDRTAVRVAVIDTTPFTDPADPRDEHGLVVAELIETIAHGCDAATPVCHVLVENVLGLPRFGRGRTDRDVDPQGRGGFIAFQSELARAVHDELLAWESSGGQEKLIINMSLGWQRPFGEEGVSPAVDALLLVLRRASCRGALIVAAAGNDRDDCEDGPLLPGAWEEYPAPTKQQCEGPVVGLAMSVPSNAPYKPLVYAVGGLDYGDTKVSVSRDGGRPRLAAIADHVVVGDITAAARTGTSMSAAVVSGIAALVWSYRGDLTAHHVARLLWDSGVPTGGNADFGVGGATFAIRRATACNALEAACAAPDDCPPEFDLDCVTTPLPVTALQDAIAAALPPVAQSVALSQGASDCSGYCTDPSAQTYYAAGADPVCPEIAGTARTEYLTTPQPDNPPCPPCGWVTWGDPDTSNYEVQLIASLAREYEGMTVTNVVVEAMLMDGTPTRFELGAQPLTVDPQALKLEPPPEDKIRSATIHITFDGISAPLSNPLLPPVER